MIGKARTIQIKTGVYDDRVTVVAPCDHEYALRWLEGRKIRDFDHIDEYKNARAITLRRTKRSASIIFMKEWKDCPDTIAILCHEAIHAANFILAESGVNEKKGCDEALTYLTHFIVRAAIRGLRRKVSIRVKKDQK
jgi:hypothetical protein